MVQRKGESREEYLRRRSTESALRYADDPEKCKAASAAWRAANPEKVKAI